MGRCFNTSEYLLSLSIPQANQSIRLRIELIDYLKQTVTMELLKTVCLQGLVVLLIKSDIIIISGYIITFRLHKYVRCKLIVWLNQYFIAPYQNHGLPP